VLTPHADLGFLSSDWEDLDRKLRTGDGLMWPGDPLLWLGVGVITAPKHAGRITRQKPLARRLEVWRDCEDGETRLIGTWHPSDCFRVLHDLCRMRAEAPGHESILDSIDNHNAKLEKAAEDAAVDKMCEGLEHALKLQHDRTEPSTVFRGIQGNGPAVTERKPAETPASESKPAESAG
jgi:hypothetical protein